MTLTTFREALVHAFRVRQSMTVITSRHRLVLVDMAGRAGNLAMLGLACRQHGIDRIMARGTESRSGVGRIGQLKRLVCLVAGRTVGLGHRLGVRLMAINTFRDIAVSVGMTEITGEGCVLARNGDHLLVGTCVAGDANRLVFPFEGYVQGLVRVVAAEARLLDFVMSAAFMTVAAQGNILRRTGAMTFVASLAINFSLVRCAVCGDLGRLLGVTLGAVIYGQNRLGKSN